MARQFSLFFVCTMMWSACFFKPAFNGDAAVKDDGAIVDAPADATMDARPLCTAPTIAANFRFSSRRNGAVGRLNADDLDDFVVHGFVPADDGGTDIPYVWVYMGNPHGINLLCPDEQYPLPEYRFAEGLFKGEIGAVYIGNLFPTKAGHTGDLLIAAQHTDGQVALRWRSYAGATAVDITRKFSAMQTPNWRDVDASTPGFIAELRKSDTSVDIYWGGGEQIYVSRLTSSDFITSEFSETQLPLDSPALMMVWFGLGRFDMATIATSAIRDGDSLFLSARAGVAATVPLTFSNLNFGKATTQISDIARQTSLTNPAVVVAKPIERASEILELSVPDPIGNHTLAPSFPNTTSIRDVFVTNFDSREPTLRNQWKLLVLKQERYSTRGGNPALVLFDVDADAANGVLVEASEKPLMFASDDTSNKFPPFMVVGNFESTNQKSVRVFHRVSGEPMTTAVDCFTLQISEAKHSTASVPGDLASVACVH